MFAYLVSLVIIIGADGFCGENIKWSHHLNIEDVYGVWYGVGYAQHTPDMTDKPNEVGCVALYISDASTEVSNDWLDWSLRRRNYSDQNWRSYRSNPWSDTPMSGSWLDIRVKRRAKRNMYTERRLRVIWDEDGQTMEQVYIYTPDEPGLWVAEKMRPGELELISRGIDVWYPDDPPRHPEVIKILKLNRDMMIINHCSDSGNEGIFSLILRRTSTRMDRSEWFDLRRQFYSFDLPPMHRHSAICAGCIHCGSVLLMFSLYTLIVLLRSITSLNFVT
ncbi:unnamed protein product [Diatraea saccharalis]|uniref:Uncharacterized protein n=1 Tax=Diatraea saccharalis TaxID=40085 RepID=A0A9N9N0V5_9NEOP|nr:unnamed protein product [Diatraea saccharalis]